MASTGSNTPLMISKTKTPDDTYVPKLSLLLVCAATELYIFVESEISRGTADKYSISGDVVEILVANEKSFHVHSSVLKSARFFQSALAEHREGQNRREVPIRLEDIEPGDFNVYVQWLYTRNLPKRSPDGRRLYSLFVDAYLLGQQIEDGEYRESAMNAIIEWWEAKKEVPPVRSVHTIYEKTTEGSPLRRIVVDIHTYGRKHESVSKADYGNRYPAEFINDFIKSLKFISISSSEKAPPWKTNREIYHADYISTGSPKQEKKHPQSTKKETLIPKSIDDAQTIPDEEYESGAQQGPN